MMRIWCCNSDTVTTATNENDADCDGVVTAEDCNDSDETNTETNVDDADCDGVATAEETDSDGSVTTIVGDCDNDGVATAIDCDDTTILLRLRNKKMMPTVMVL